MPVTKDNWYSAFGTDGNGLTIMRTVVVTGGGAAHPKDTDFGLEQCIDPVTGAFRVIVTS